MENPIKMDDLGGKPTIFGNTHVFLLTKNLDGHHMLTLQVFRATDRAINPLADLF